MSRRSWSVASSSRAAEDAARAVLPAGNAADAIVAGVFGACAAHPAVLLGSLQVLIVGPAVGARAIDGRAMQPGRGTRRPRGFVEGVEIPAAARVAVPGLPSALATTATAFGTMTLVKAATPGIEIAKAESKLRAKVLGRIARMGAAALRESQIADPWLEVAGVLAGGLLTEADLAESVATIHEVERGDTVRVPWAEDHASVGDMAALAVADSRGTLAVACWEQALDGLRIEALDLVAPLVAIPVRRGATRVTPGTRLATPSPIRIEGDLAEAFAGMGRSSVRVRRG